MKMALPMKRPISRPTDLADTERRPKGGRPRKPVVFIPSGFREAIRVKFLNHAIGHASRALSRLAEKGARMAEERYPTDPTEAIQMIQIKDASNEIPGIARQWATEINEDGTWLEQWAAKTLRAWCVGACPFPKLEDGR